ncbi:MAG: rhodanese-like domain-containing protein [Chthoniobacterales bacterium]|nr:rhodanese-like domain-containing protein [Chthoniobacterales bacterium]
MSSSLTDSKNPTTSTSMGDLLKIYPGARRTLFQRYHLGGCSSCSFSLEETLEELCERNGKLDPSSILKELEETHLADEQLLVTPESLRDHLYDSKNDHLRLLDIRTREEFEAVHIPTSELLTQELMEETMNHWPKENLLVLIDHRGERSLDAAAYFSGHGFVNVKSLRGGIDAYAENVDRSLPQYTVESCSTETEAQD